MARLKLDLQTAQAAVLGGAVLGGGGGGSMVLGREVAELAVRLGEPELVDIDDLPGEAWLVTVAAVGAPAAREAAIRPVDYLRAVELLTRNAGLKVDGFITNECGGAAVVNGWLQSALLGVPVVDAPCNGRAHPTGVMGSMGLHAVPGYVSSQAAAGGDTASGRYLEIYARGSLERAAGLIRQGAVQAGGLVAVARNPVQARYAKENGAPGAVRQAIRLGREMLAAQPGGGPAVIDAIVATLGGELAARGPVGQAELETSGGFDRGRVLLGDSELTFWNEYMTLERSGSRVATFPDLMATLDVESGMPVSTAEIARGQEVAVLVVPREKLLLGAGMRYAGLFRQIEEVTGKPVIPYLRGGAMA